MGTPTARFQTRLFVWNPGNYLSSRQGLGPESVGSPVTSGSVSEALSPRAAPSRCASFATLGCCERRTWSGGDSRATTALDGGRQRDTYLVSQAMPSRSRSSSSRYPGSPRYKGAAPASFAFLQLGSTCSPASAPVREQGPPHHRRPGSPLPVSAQALTLAQTPA